MQRWNNIYSCMLKFHLDETHSGSINHARSIWSEFVCLLHNCFCRLIVSTVTSTCSGIHYAPVLCIWPILCVLWTVSTYPLGSYRLRLMDNINTLMLISLPLFVLLRVPHWIWYFVLMLCALIYGYILCRKKSQKTFLIGRKKVYYISFPSCEV